MIRRRSEGEEDWEGGGSRRCAMVLGGVGFRRVLSDVGGLDFVK